MSDGPSPAPLVARVTPLDRRGRRVRVELDDDSSIEIALEVLERAGLGVGDPADARLSAELLDQDLRWRAREAALGYLAHRVRSRGEVQRRLRKDAFPQRIVDACLERLAEQGLLDDGVFADAFVRDRLTLRPRGPARLRDELRGKGVAPEVAQAAIAKGLEHAGQTDQSLAVSAALRWLAGKGARERAALAAAPWRDERQGALRRLTGFLQRRGFGGDAVRAAVGAVDAQLRRDDA